MPLNQTLIQSLIKFNDYCLQTPTGRILKSDLSLELNVGDVLVISGDNGAGKTTLLKEIEKMLILSFITLPQLSESEINFPFTIADLNQNKKHSFTQAQLRTPFNNASGGERRRALFYYLLNQKKEVLLLDEPFNHLDYRTAEELVILLKESLKKEQTKALIIISHSHREIISKHLNFKECRL